MSNDFNMFIHTFIHSIPKNPIAVVSYLETFGKHCFKCINEVVEIIKVCFLRVWNGRKLSKKTQNLSMGFSMGIEIVLMLLRKLNLEVAITRRACHIFRTS